MIDNLSRFLRFGIVGCTGILIDFSVTWLCREKLNANKFVANAAGFTCAVVSNYFLNKLWTFKNSNANIFYQFVCFLAISVCGLLLNTCLLYFFHQKKKSPFYIAKLAAIAIVFFWNFAANNLLTFSYQP